MHQSREACCSRGCRRRSAVVGLQIFWLALPSLLFTTSAQADDWKKIGVSHASHDAETDKIDVSDSREFRQVKFKVEVMAIYFKSVRIVFQDGDEQRVSIGPMSPPETLHARLS